MDSGDEFAMQLETVYLDLKSQLIIEINSECLQVFANAFIENDIVCITRDYPIPSLAQLFQ